MEAVNSKAGSWPRYVWLTLGHAAHLGWLGLLQQNTLWLRQQKTLWLRQQIVLIVLEAGKSRNKAWVDSVSGKVPLHGL